MKTTTIRLVAAAFVAASIALPGSGAMAQGSPTCSESLTATKRQE